jgi:transcriptional regulator GlxA family with amidase domain
MRPAQLDQVARVAIIVPPCVRLGSVGVLVDGFEMTRSHIRRQYGAVDNLSSADRFDVSQIGVFAVNANPVKTEGGLIVQAEPIPFGRDFDIIAIADYARIPGADFDSGRVPPFEEWLRRQHIGGAIIAACGASVHFLLESGLTDGCRLATPGWLITDLLGNWPNALLDGESATVEEGQFLTGRGGIADYEIVQRLVETVTSRNIGRWLSSHIGLQPESNISAWGPGSLLERAQEWLANRFSQPVRIEDLARDLGVTRRTLHRHFVRGAGLSPVAYLQSLRIEAAKRMLERAAFPIERIAALVGYADTAHFRQAFRKNAGMSPRQWRAVHAYR